MKYLEHGVGCPHLLLLGTEHGQQHTAIGSSVAEYGRQQPNTKLQVGESHQQKNPKHVDYGTTATAQAVSWRLMKAALP